MARSKATIMQAPVAVEQQVAPKSSLSQLSWDDLRLFWELSEGVSMRQAGLRLELHASTVSRRCAELEEVLETQLFQRHPEGLQLTPAGEELRIFTERMHREVQELKNQVAGRDGELRGSVRVTTAEAVTSLVYHALAQVVEAHPALDIEVISSDGMSDLSRHEAEIAVRVAEHPPEYLVGTRVGRADVGVFASPCYLKRMGSDLCHPQHRWIAWPSYVDKKPAFAWLNEKYPGRKTVLRANSANSVLQAARCGLGLAPLAVPQAHGDSALILLERLPEECSTSTWLLTHRDTKKSARVRAVMSLLDAALRLSLKE